LEEKFHKISFQTAVKLKKKTASMRKIKTVLEEESAYAEEKYDI